MSIQFPSTTPDAQLGFVSVAEAVRDSWPAQSDVPRVAALLTSISRNNAYEGRDAFYISDNLSCGFIVDLLGISVQDLSEALLVLQRRGWLDQRVVACALPVEMRWTSYRQLPIARTEARGQCHKRR